MLVKCKICGQFVDRDIAYKRVVNGKNLYYHSEEEYISDFEKKNKNKLDKARAYRLVCDILGVNEIINTALWKEWQIWNKAASDDVIGDYLSDNKDELTKLISRLDSNIYPRIRYLSAVLKNRLGDYKPKPKPVKETHPINIDEGYETKYKQKKQKPSLDDLEGDFNE